MADVQINIAELNGITTQKSVTTDALGDLASGQHIINASYGGNSSFKSNLTSQKLT